MHVTIKVPLRYSQDPRDTRTGYYVLPPNWRNRNLPVMVLFHGLAGFGGTTGGRKASDRGILGTGSGLTFLVSPNVDDWKSAENCL